MSPQRTLILIALLLTALLARAEDAPKPQAYALIVAGDGGDANFTENYRDWSVRLQKVLTETCGVPAGNVRVLLEKKDLAPIACGTSDKESVLKTFNELNAKMKSGDQFSLFYIGHGTAQGSIVKLCVPGPDITSEETADLLSKANAKEVIFVNSAAASSGFLEKCSAPGRVLITSTNNSGEGNETYFMEFFLRAYEKGDHAQTAKQTLLDAFNTAATECPKWYLRQYFEATSHAWRVDGKQARELWTKFYAKVPDKKMTEGPNSNADDAEPVLGEWGEQWASRRMPSEHAQLDDNGDKLGTAVFVNNVFTPLAGTEDGADGFIARKIVLGKPGGAK